MSLTQSEADALISMPKVFEDDDHLILGDFALDYERKLVSLDGKEVFSLDVWRGSLNLRKYRLQNRARSIEILVRVDVNGSPHRNPDGEIIPCPHIHIYKEGYNDKWAYPLANHNFRDPEDIFKTFEDFAEFCNIIRFPEIQRKLI